MVMTKAKQAQLEMRVYPLDPKRLTQEQIAVTFAMTSRNPASFEEIQQAVTEAKAADFHEKWVVNYGHASVAEHAVLHMAVENISRLACDELEDNRLASYTEKSSRYQVLDRGSYYIPAEIRGHPLERDYVRACDALFDLYHGLVDRTIAHLRTRNPRNESEKETAYVARLRRIATDHCRFVLPASTLTNVGVTMNARSMEHAIAKLLSSDLAESRELGARLKKEGQAITPTLIRYADRSEYLAGTRGEQLQAAKAYGIAGAEENKPGPSSVSAHLVHYDPHAQDKLVAALLYRFSGRSYEAVFNDVLTSTTKHRNAAVEMALKRLGPYDPPLRELETVDYTFDLLLDYGAYREFRRHRMQTTIAQPLTVLHGYVVPPLIADAGAEGEFRKAMDDVHDLFEQLVGVSPAVAQYAVTHAHLTRVLAKMNLRECYHLFKLRRSPQAHFTIQEVAAQAMQAVRSVHPLLMKYVKLRS